MFICDNCLEANFNNKPSLFKSAGVCEYCLKAEVCSEIHHDKLVKKDAPQANASNEVAGPISALEALKDYKDTGSRVDEVLYRVVLNEMEQLKQHPLANMPLDDVQKAVDFSLLYISTSIKQVNKMEYEQIADNHNETVRTIILDALKETEASLRKDYERLSQYKVEAVETE